MILIFGSGEAVEDYRCLDTITSQYVPLQYASPRRFMFYGLHKSSLQSLSTLIVSPVAFNVCFQNFTPQLSLYFNSLSVSPYVFELFNKLLQN